MRAIDPMNSPINTTRGSFIFMDFEALPLAANSQSAFACRPSSNLAWIAHFGARSGLQTERPRVNLGHVLFDGGYVLILSDARRVQVVELLNGQSDQSGTDHTDQRIDVELFWFFVAHGQLVLTVF